MTTLQEGATAFAKAHPLTPSGTSWEDGCARLSWDWSASFTPGWSTGGANVSTAAHAMANSTLFWPVDPNDILPGRYIWIEIPGSAAGHVGFVVAGQGLDALVFWATSVLQIKLGNFIGFGTMRAYAASSFRGIFLGVSEDYAGALPNLSAFEEVGPPTPIPTPVIPMKGTTDMELYAAVAPTPVPAKYLAVNAGLVAGAVTYVLIPSGQPPRVTQNQTLAAQWSQQLFNQPSATGIIGGIAWAQFDQWFDQATAAVVAGSATVDLTPVETQLEQSNAALLAMATALGQDTTAIEAAIAAEPAATVKAEGAALSNG